MTTLTKEKIQKYNQPGPRYTSYPTAPVWTDKVNERVYIEKLKQFGATPKTLSLYIHIPFCQTMCTYCACNVIIRRHDEKYADEYIHYLEREIDLVCGHIGRRKTIRQFHLGGGTPNFLNENQLKRLMAKIHAEFDIDASAEIAIEIDPRTVHQAQIRALREAGFNRISMGIQDFNHDVQVAANRIQPFELVETVTHFCRQAGIESINFDLIYGLPKQTVATFEETIQKVMVLKPDRIALYSFAYVPWLKKHQTKINIKDLPMADEKMDIFLTARMKFLENGYRAIAMDHFALETDELARAFNHEELYRNFMGYTVKPADEYIGLGITAIGFLENTYIQNHKILSAYYRLLDANKLPIERGVILSLDDQIRRWVINALMCQFKINKQQFKQAFQMDFDEYFLAEQGHIRQCVDEELLFMDNDSIRVSEAGKFFIRNICMGFDRYFKEQTSKRFSQTI